MFDDSIVTILFRLINFVALIALAIVLFKRYFLSDITEKIDQEEVEKDTLRHNIIILEQQGNALSDNMIEQEQLCLKLSDRVEQWHHVFNQEIEKKRKDNLDLRIKTAERNEMQKKMITQDRLMAAIIPQAIEQVQTTLIKKFSAPDKNKNFVFDIIDHIKKRS